MIHPLAVTLMSLTGALALFGIVTTVLGRPAERPHVLAVGVVEALLVVQALLAAARVFGGARPAETSTFLIYLLVSVTVLPLGLQFARAEPTRWGGAVIAVASLAVGVVVWRLLSLWGATGG
jgi:predicted membrane channel-forming protein YqfA (hemolysin III family)